MMWNFEESMTNGTLQMSGSVMAIFRKVPWLLVGLVGRNDRSSNGSKTNQPHRSQQHRHACMHACMHTDGRTDGRTDGAAQKGRSLMSLLTHRLHTINHAGIDVEIQHHCTFFDLRTHNAHVHARNKRKNIEHTSIHTYIARGDHTRTHARARTEARTHETTIAACLLLRWLGG